MTESKYNYIVDISNTFRCFFHIGDEVSDFIGCLFALESNFGTSKLAVECNNHCSMKVPFVRISTASNFATLDTWACYSGRTSCEIDFALWVQFQKPLRKQLESIELFIPLLRSYCPEKDYISKIQSIYQQFKNYKNE